ncbi:hypothetical protein FA95DRAFT_1487466, partial [Auriscalpium vulgare]
MDDELQSLPDTAARQREIFLDGYTCPAIPPFDTPKGVSLDQSETISLKHWVTWKKTNGTVKAYSGHAQNLQENTGIEILSLYNVRKLASKVTGLIPDKTDMCVNSCLAYTGEFENMKYCPYIKKNGNICGQPRYRPQKKAKSPLIPRAQMLSLPLIPTLRALFANADTSKLMRSRDRYLQQTIELLAAGGAQKFSDFSSGTVHVHHHESMGIFQKERDIALALSTDGAQLTMKKQSDTWILILTLLNLPPELRYQASNVIIPLAIPGPQAPGHIESYL